MVDIKHSGHWLVMVQYLGMCHRILIQLGDDVSSKVQRLDDTNKLYQNIVFSSTGSRSLMIHKNKSPLMTYPQLMPWVDLTFRCGSFTFDDYPYLQIYVSLTHGRQVFSIIIPDDSLLINGNDPS